MVVPVAGQIIRASDVITFEDAKPRVHAYDSVGNVVLNTAVVKLIAFDAEAYDTSGTMHTGGNPSRLVAPIDGLYRFTTLVRFPSATYTVGLLNVRQDAAGSSTGGTSLQNIQFHATGGSTGPSPSSNFTRALTAGQYLEVFCSQTSGADRTNVVGLFGSFATLEYVASV